MASRFKSKRKLKTRYQIMLFILAMSSSFFFIFNMLYKKYALTIDNNHLINYLVDYNLNTKDEKNILYDIISLNSTDFLLKYTLGVESNESDYIDEEGEGVEATYVEDPYETKIDDPIIYLYNTHQTEGYQKSNNADYNITPSVLMASYILRETLNDLGLPTLVETNDITEILRIHNWKYKYSYAASKILMQDAITKNSKLTYFFDIHRDSMNYDVTTAEIDGKKYAKILFVIGKDHDNYEQNLALAEKINEQLKKFNPNISRGISLQGGSNVNGIYNQDLNPNVVLLEIGGQYNNITEINNTIEVLAAAIYETVKEDI